MAKHSGLGDDDGLGQKVILFVADRTGRDPATISRSDTLSDLHFDSLDFLDLVMGLEDEFEVSVPDQPSAEMRTVQDLIDEIRKWRRR